MIEKTLNTFPSSMSLLAHQYRLEYENERVKTFSDLMNILQKKERHHEIILNNNARPVGTKKIPETYQASGGRAPRKKKTDRAASYTRRQSAPRGGGKGNQPRGPNRILTWKRDGGATANNQGGGRSGLGSSRGGNPPPNSVKHGRSSCFKCGSTMHMHKQCRASKDIQDIYKRHKQYLAQEANLTSGDYEMDIGDAELTTNLTIAYFETKKSVSLESIETPDFD